MKKFTLTHWLLIFLSLTLVLYVSFLIKTQIQQIYLEIEYSEKNNALIYNIIYRISTIIFLFINLASLLILIYSSIFIQNKLKLKIIGIILAYIVTLSYILKNLIVSLYGTTIFIEKNIAIILSLFLILILITALFIFYLKKTKQKNVNDTK